MRRAALLLCAAILTAGCGESKRSSEPGRHLVYTRFVGDRGRSVWVADANGRHQHLLVRRAGTGHVSPDGRLVAFDRPRATNAYVIGTDGRDERLVARHVVVLDWTPDGTRLLGLRGAALVTIAVGDGDVTVLEPRALDRRTRSTQWAFSPDGRRLVYARLTGRRLARDYCFSGADLYLVGLDGTGRRALVRDGRSSAPSWGSGGIAFRRDLRDCTAGGLWRIRPDGTGLRPLIARPPSKYTRFGFYGFVPYAWLDRRRLVVGLRNEWGDDAALLDAGRLRPLGMQIDTTSRDGRLLLGAQAGAEWPATIEIGSVTGGRRRVVTRGRVCCPDWNR